jgi:hypothetical protein
MYSPALHSLLGHAHVEELQRATQTRNRGRDTNRPPAARRSTLIKRAVNRAFAGAPPVNHEAAPLHGFKLIGCSFAATLRPRS